MSDSAEAPDNEKCELHAWMKKIWKKKTNDLMSLSALSLMIASTFAITLGFLELIPGVIQKSLAPQYERRIHCCLLVVFSFGKTAQEVIHGTQNPLLQNPIRVA